MRRLALGLAILLMGCSNPPPVINITVVIPPAQPAPAQKPEPVKTSWHDEAEVQGDWPQWGWRVFANGGVEGPPFEQIEQCYQAALVVQERPDSVGPAQCHWVAAPPPAAVNHPVSLLRF